MTAATHPYLKNFMRLTRPFFCNNLLFILLAALFFTLFQNIAFWVRLWPLVDFKDLQDYLFVLSIPLFVFATFNFFFALLVQPWIGKPLLIVLLLISAVINYFCLTYGVVIDKDMIQNTMQTDTQETVSLITPQLIIWVLCLGVIPAVVVCRIKLTYHPTWWYNMGLRLVSILGSVFIIALIALLFYKDYAPLVRNNKPLVKVLTPTNFVSSTYSYFRQEYQSHQPLKQIGLDAQKTAPTGRKKSLFIIVVGETARAENFSLNGYSSNTNPLLSQRNVINFRQVSSCGTATAISVPCMFSDMPRTDYNASQAEHQEGLMDVLSHAKFNVLWRENDSGCKGACDRVATEEIRKLDPKLPCVGDLCRDEELLNGLDDYLNRQTDDTVIVLHTNGSHGPAYYQRYPDAMRRFTPTCDTNQIQNCDRQSLINTYNNTIVYTDYVLNKVIDLLQRHQTQFSGAMLYLSDHGESLGENGLYLHGAPYMIAPSQQTHIPMIFWSTADFLNQRNINRSCLAQNAKNKPYSQDNLFHSVLGVLDVKTEVYDSTLDLFNQCRQA